MKNRLHLAVSDMSFTQKVKMLYTFVVKNLLSLVRNRSRAESVRSKSPLTASPASPGPLSNSFHGSFHGSLGSDGMSCSSARSSSASPDSARYTSAQVNIFSPHFFFVHSKLIFSSQKTNINYILNPHRALTSIENDAVDFS